MAVLDRIPLQHSVAVVTENSIVVRPARIRLLVPLLQALVAVGAVLLMVALLNGGAPLLLLVLLLVVVLLLGPSAVLGLIYGLVGANVTIERQKQSVRLQQGFLGLGIGTADLVPFSRIASIDVVGDYDRDLFEGELPDFTHWEVRLVKDNGRVLDIGEAVAPRLFAAEALERANRLALAIAALTGASASTVELPAEEAQDDPEETVTVNRRRRRISPRRGRPAPATREDGAFKEEGAMADRALELLGEARTIAVVGVSARPDRDSHEVAKYLIEAGYDVYLVNPREREILGRTVYERVQDLPLAVDIVDIFRRSSDVPEVVEDAIAARAGAVWMQLEIVNEDAAARARAAGLEVVMDRCTKIEHGRLTQAQAAQS